MHSNIQHPGRPLSVLKYVLFVSVFFILIALTFKNSRAQYFRVFDIETKNFPIVKAKFLLNDASGNQIHDISEKNVKINENDKISKLLDIEPPKKTDPKPLSVVLAFDVSYSMKKERLKLAKEAGKTLINLLPLDQSECAITSFDDLNYLNQDFTYSASKLTSAIDSLHARGGTNYNSGFSSPFAGALNIAKNGHHKKVVIFLTDGLGEGNRERIISIANKHDIAVYPVTVKMETPQILKDIAGQSGGKHYENVGSAKEAQKIYKEILYTSQSTSFGTIKWKSNAGCKESVSAAFTISGYSFQEEYELKPNQLRKLIVNPKYVSFNLKKDSIKTIRLKAQNGSFSVTNFSFDKTKGFTTAESQLLPKTLQANESMRLNIRPVKNKVPSGFTRLSIENNKCPAVNVYLQAGEVSSDSSLLKLLSPNGGETMIAGTQAKVKWEGISKNDAVNLALSTDNGKTWEAISKTDGLQSSWRIPPKTGKENLMRVKLAKDSGGDLSLSFMYTLSGKSYKAHNARFVKNDKFILSMNDNHSLSLWEGNSGEHIQSYSFHDKWIYDIFENPQNDDIVTASDDGTAKVFNLLTGQGKNIFNVNSWAINKAVFFPNGKQLATAGDDGALRIWNTQNGHLDYSIRAHMGWIMDLSISPDGNYLATAGDDRMVKIWNRSSLNRHLTIYAHNSWVHDVEFHPEGNKIITAGKDSSVRIWNIHNGRMVRAFDNFYGEVFSASFSPDGKYFVTTAKDGTMRVYHTNSGELMDFNKVQKGNWYLNAYFDHSGKRIISADHKRNIKIWGIEKGATSTEDISDEPFTIISPLPEIAPVQFSPQLTGKVTDTLIDAYFENPKSYPVYVKNVSITGKHKNAFSLTAPTGGFIIPPNESKSIEIQFQPKKAGENMAEISVASAARSTEKAISGKGIKPEYRVLNNQINFGLVDIKHTSDTLLPLIRNTGNNPLKLKNINLTGAGKQQFSFDNLNPVSRIDPGKTGEVKISFTPKDGGLFNSKLQFSVSDHKTIETLNMIGKGNAPRSVIIRGKVLSVHDSSSISAHISCFDIKTQNKVDSIHLKPKDRFAFRLKRDRKYRISASKKKYIPAGIHVDLSKYPSAQTLSRNIYLSKVKVGAKVRLNNIFFEYDKSRLTTSSKGELNQVYEFLQKNPAVQIEVAGHTDSMGSSQYNKNLSLARAKSVKNYLVNKGIQPMRIKVAGYGENKPIADNSTPSGREKNRRVEFEILQKD
jgi:WD40 repeat protein/outer membrane protein OmpA-like peptidoglycan-associated protein/Mg-chelatase subunit ChlD